MSCPLCGKPARIAEALGACVSCIRAGRPEPLARARAVRQRVRAGVGLPLRAPRGGPRACDRCFRRCAPPPGELGYCGVRRVSRDPPFTMDGGDASGLVHWYWDRLPTNCCSEWVCAVGSGSAALQEGRLGPRAASLAVFAYGCTFDCLYCQNVSCREVARSAPAPATAAALAEVIDRHTVCACFFGGDPTPQLPFALEATRLARQGRSFHVCWETNGAMSPALLDRIIDRALETGGTVKFDLKARHPALHRALTDAPRRPTWRNLTRLLARAAERPPGAPPLATVSTCLVPGYVDPAEVDAIARALAALDPATPYSLLAFYPNYLMTDLPTTSRRHAEACLAAARATGLTRTRIGNQHLLR